MPTLLTQSGRLGQHTKIILMTRRSGDAGVQLECSTFALAHTQTQPWGIEIPGQCPQCGSTNSWEKVSVKEGESIKQYIFRCLFRDCSRDQLPDRLPPYRILVTKPEGSLVNGARMPNCGWFQSPSTFFAEPSHSGEKRKAGVLASRSKKGRREC